MTDLVSKLPLATLALLIGTALMLVAVLSQVTTKWFTVTLSKYQRLLIGVIGVSLTVVAFLPKDTRCPAASRCLPVWRMPLVEKADAIGLQDGGGTLFVRAREIHRYVDQGDTRRPFIELEYDSKEGLLAHKTDVYGGQSAEISLPGDRNYTVWYERSGKLDKPATDPNAEQVDVALISIERKR